MVILSTVSQAIGLFSTANPVGCDTALRSCLDKHSDNIHRLLWLLRNSINVIFVNAFVEIMQVPRVLNLWFSNPENASSEFE